MPSLDIESLGVTIKRRAFQRYNLLLSLFDPPSSENDVDDDGGSNKDNNRLYRRKARRWIGGSVTILIVLLICFLLIFLRKYRQQEKVQKKKDIRWVDPRQVPPINGKFTKADLIQLGLERDKTLPASKFLHSYKKLHKMPWEKYFSEYNATPTIRLDYTKHKYKYPTLALTPPPFEEYPPLDTLESILNHWPQDDYDSPPTPFREKLQHFDFTKEEEVQGAIKYRESELPFKVYNVPEVISAGQKWTLDYLSSQFDEKNARGYCEESEDNFFGFFVRESWKRKLVGPYPVSQNDLTFRQFTMHAYYADSTGLKPEEKHFYWQAGVPTEERYKPSEEWSFISVDLPSFSSTDPTFFGFNPNEQKGIQCRFGERGVVAATHYDAGRNMIAMMTGAKRYILAPPNQCSKLGILKDPKVGGYRHSYINFGHITFLQDPTMPFHEREWLNAAKDSLAVETVLKEGEVLYIPSHWFHYIISLQRSAQCNTRSGRDVKGNTYFGGMADVESCT